MMANSESMEILRKEIEASGGPDKYIDSEEEAHVFEKGKTLGIPKDSVEAILNHMCRSGAWTREFDIVRDLEDMLDEVARKYGGIEQKAFDHCISYGVSMNMPRRRATELSVKYVCKSNFKIKKGLLKGDWFKSLREQYGG